MKRPLNPTSQRFAKLLEYGLFFCITVRWQPSATQQLSSPAFSSYGGLSNTKVPLLRSLLVLYTAMDLSPTISAY